MASGPTLPPQAYTRETLTAAFNWLQTQPDSVRKLATTPDALVGLFVRAQRFGSSSLEADAPVSSQNFISDLKSLAEGMKQFDDQKSNAPSESFEEKQHEKFGAPQSPASSGRNAGNTDRTRPPAPTPPPTASANAYISGTPFSGAGSQQTQANTSHASAQQQQQHAPRGNYNPRTIAQEISREISQELAQQMGGHSQNAQYGSQQNPTNQSHLHAEYAANFGAPSTFSQIAQQNLNAAFPGGSLGSAMNNNPAMYSNAMLNAYAASGNAVGHPNNLSPAARLGLNERTWQMIQEVKTHLNLSSDHEAINMMVSLAYRSLKNLLVST